MIIFGTTGITSTKAKGNFTCPQCANNRLYKHRKVTRFFTLYFIPLIPLGSVGEYVGRAQKSQKANKNKDLVWKSK